MKSTICILMLALGAGLQAADTDADNLLKSIVGAYEEGNTEALTTHLGDFETGREQVVLDLLDRLALQERNVQAASKELNAADSFKSTLEGLAIMGIRKELNDNSDDFTESQTFLKTIKEAYREGDSEAVDSYLEEFDDERRQTILDLLDKLVLQEAHMLELRKDLKAKESFQVALKDRLQVLLKITLARI